MVMHMQGRGIIYSVILHLVAFLLILFGLPSLYEQKSLEEQVITVEILPVSEFTNVRKIKPKPVVKPIKKDVTAAVEPKLSLPDPTARPVITPAPEPVIRKPEERVKEKAIEPLKRPEPKPKAPKPKPEPKKEVKPVETPEEAFASVLKSVEELNAGKEDKEEEAEESVDFSDVEDFLSNVKNEPEFKPGLPLSISEKDAIRQQIMRNWSLSSVSGGRDVQEMVVTLNIKMARDGSVSDVKIENQLRYNTDSFFRAIADSAVRAVLKSSPLKELPIEKYDVKDGWREIQMNFDPSEMFY